MEVTTYEKLNVFIDRWISGTIDLLIIESEAGLGKSILVKEKLNRRNYLLINSYTTPLANYKKLYEHRDVLVWFDDVYCLLLNQLNVSLMKQLCETQKVKVLSYYTTSELIEEVPEQFNTTSRVLITCNAMERDNPHLRAIKDRAFYIRFNPTRVELINKMREISQEYPYLELDEKQEVLELIEQNINHVRRLSLRSLIKGFQLYEYFKLKGTEWKEDLLKELGISDKLIKLNELLVKYDSDLDRLKEWEWSKQTFYAYKKMVDFQT